MENKIYLIGHKSPDLDTVAAPIAYAKLKNELEHTDIYIPAVLGELNKETKFALNKFGFAEPEALTSVAGKNVILIDHNEFSQSADGIEEAKILEILDHHKLNFEYTEPIEVNTKPWGASATIVADEYLKHGLHIDKKLAGLLLSAILIDTVITKSPTTTEKDKEIINELAEISGITNWQDFGMQLFKIRSSVSELSDEEIIKSDFKDFKMKAGLIGGGQVETVDLKEFEAREDSLMKSLEKIKEEGGYHTAILFITDIINVGSKFLVVSDDTAGVEKALNCKLDNGKCYLKGVISRKKQVTPFLTEVFDK